MELNEVEIFKKTIIFILENSLAYLENKKDKYEKDTQIKEKSEHVYKENLTVMEEEIFYLKRTIELIKNFSIEGFNSIEEFKEKLLKDIKEYYHYHGIPMICYAFLSDKVEASVNFVKEIFK